MTDYTTSIITETFERWSRLPAARRMMARVQADAEPPPLEPDDPAWMYR
jgi:hypothetical protein